MSKRARNLIEVALWVSLTALAVLGLSLLSGCQVDGHGRLYIPKGQCKVCDAFGWSCATQPAVPLTAPSPATQPVKK